MSIQLIPLPPNIFLSLPGHAPFAQAADIAGNSQPWRPLSLVPDLTLNSLLALLIPLAVLVGYAGLNADDRARTPFLVAGVVIVSAVFAAAQLTGGQDSIAYLYRSTSVTLPVGLLANRNHQATLMAIGLAWAAWWRGRDEQTRSGIGAAIPIMLAATAFGLVGLITGSRSGLLLMAIGIVLGFLSRGKLRKLQGSRRGSLAIVSGGLCVVAVVAVAALFDRAASIDRLADSRMIGSDMRFRALPVMEQMVRTYAPWGSGFGTFDPVFRIHEPDALLNPMYFNNAHNDYLETLITGGATATIVLVVTVVWLGLRGWSLIMGAKSAPDRDRDLGRLGLVTTVLLGIASISDYPLRAPIMALIGSIALCWVAAAQNRDLLVSPKSLG